MPVGKNSIKRVANNGYSNVKTEAPDMENSTEVVCEEPKPEKKAKKKPVAAKTTGKRKADKNEVTEAPKTSYESEPELAPISTLEKVTEKTETQSNEASYTNLGKEMPVYLL